MKESIVRPVLVLLLAGLLPSAASAHDHTASDGGASAPVRYILNKGQLPSNVLYRADVGMTALFMEQDRLTWSRLQADAGEIVHDRLHEERDLADLALKGHAWSMRFVAASSNVTVKASDRDPAYLNYFLGNDPAHWASGVPMYHDVRYEGIWPGVDLRMYSASGGFKYDLELAAGADPGRIAMAYEGLEGLEVDRAGRLVLRTSVGDVIETAPVAWYADGVGEHVDCRYHLEGNVLGFRFAPGTDHSRPIVVDPLLIASTLSGTGNIGTTQNYGHSATYDALGNIYTGARCFGQGYPSTPGAFQMNFGGGGVDISVSKLTPDGSALTYATYLGGSGSEYPHSLVVAPNGELCVYGSSDSQNYPVSANAYDPTNNGGVDIVVTRLSVDGTTIIGSTYVGGNAQDGRNTLTTNYGDQYRGEIITDVAGNILIASCSASPNFPTTAGAYQTTAGGAQDGVLFRLNPNLSALDWSTLIGGTGGDMCFGLKLDGAGNVYACGGTNSPAFPTTAGAYQTALQGDDDAFIIHLTNNGGTLTSSTLFGTPMEDDAFFIQLDQDGDVYIYGQTDDTFPIAPAGTYGNVGGDIFIAQFDPALTSTIFTSVIGNPGGFGSSMVPVAFLVDVCDHIYVSGYSVSSGLATTPGALYTTGGFYLAAYDVDMAGLLYATYYEGANHVDGGTSRFDSDGIIYQGVCTSGPFPTTAGAYSNVQPSGWDIGVFKIDFQVAGVNAAGAGTLNQGCAPIQIDFLNNSTGNQWIWDFGDGSPPDTTYQPSHTYTSPGSYTVMLIAFDSLSCNLADTITFPVTIGQAQTLTAAFTSVQNADCQVFQISTTNSSTGAPLAFDWDMGDGTLYTDTNVVHNYAGPGNYDVQLIAYDPTGCSPPDTVVQTITINPPDTVAAAFTVDQVPDCADLIITTTNTSIGPGPNYQWDMGDGTLLTGTNVTHTYTAVGNYTVTLIATDSLTCNIADTTALQITVDPVEPVLAAFTIDQVFDCAQMVASTTNQSMGSFMGFQWDMGDGTQYADTNVTHAYTTPGTYDITLIVSDLLGCTPSDTATAQVTIDPLIPVVADFTVQQTDSCTLLLVATTNMSTGDSVSYQWDMGDGTILNTFDVVHGYASAGTYDVTLTVTDLGCGQDDQMTVQVSLIDDLPTALVPTAVICYGETAVLDATANVDGYLWSTGETTPTITVDAGGIYYVDVYTGTCFGSDTVEVLAGQLLDLGYSFEACPKAVLTLTVPYQGTAYQWSTGGNGQSEQVVGAGEYVFTVWDDLGCPHVDTITVIPLDPDARLFAPNAFTPDGDGLNDEFVITGYGVQDAELMIFDRWGEQIYSTTAPFKPWDGRYNGQPVKNDVYVYRLEYNAECETTETTTVFGHVTVVR